MSGFVLGFASALFDIREQGCVMGASYCAWNSRSAALIVDEKPLGGVSISASVGASGANRKPDVLAVQQLLNKASRIVGSPKLSIKEDGLIGPKTIGAIREFQASQLGFNDGRVDPNHRTIGRLNVLTASPVPEPQTPGGVRLGFAIPAGSAKSVAAPATAPATKMTPLQAAIDATPTAILWTTAATAHLTSLLTGLKLSGGVIFLPQVFDVVNTHFHLDRSPNQIFLNLQTLIRNFGLILQMLSDPPSSIEKARRSPRHQTRCPSSPMPRWAAFTFPSPIITSRFGPSIRTAAPKPAPPC